VRYVCGIGRFKWGLYSLLAYGILGPVWGSAGYGLEGFSAIGAKLGLYLTLDAFGHRQRG
jgi:hypothetical protein